jgi:hypothetical protein
MYVCLTNAARCCLVPYCSACAVCALHQQGRSPPPRRAGERARSRSPTRRPEYAGVCLRVGRAGGWVASGVSTPQPPHKTGQAVGAVVEGPPVAAQMQPRKDTHRPHADSRRPRCCCVRSCTACLPAVRVPLYPFATPVRDYSEMARRYTHMFVCPDLVRVVFKWAQVRGRREALL